MSTSAFYSRVASISLKKETTPATPVTPDQFFGINEESVVTQYPLEPAQPVSANRTMNLRAVKKAVPAPTGSIKLNIEPKQFGYLAEGVYGTLTEGNYLPMNTVVGTFQIGETVTGGTSAKSGTVAFVSTEYLLITAPTGNFIAAETITGGTSGATAKVTAFDTTVYGHRGKLPQNTMPTFTLQFNFQDTAVRYFGVRFTALDQIAQSNNIITADVKMISQQEFREGKITTATVSGAGAKQLILDQTKGLVAGDTIKLWRPGTGFMEFSAALTYTHTITTVNDDTHITVTNLQTSTIAGDLIVLAPQTATYSVGDEFAWIGSTTGKIGDALSSLAVADFEDFTYAVINAYEERHAATGFLPKDRFPAAIIQKGLTAKGSFKAYYKDETYYRLLRLNTQQAFSIACTGKAIGVTALNYEIDFIFPNVQFDSFQTSIAKDAVVNQAIPFTAYYDSTTGELAELLLINDVASY